jgi:hypothetical protein
MLPAENDRLRLRGQHPGVNDDQAMNSRPRGAGEPAARGVSVLRATLFADAVVFLGAALFNFGAQLTIGSADLSFPNPVWQAGVGEAVIGLALLAGAFRPYGRGAWVAFWMSVVGIAFGLSSSRVQGPAREVHLVLVPLAILVFGLLIWRWQHGHRPPGSAAGSPDDGRLGASPESLRTSWRPMSLAICGLMALATVSFALASLVHFGIVLPLGLVTLDDPFAGAAIPEAVIAIVLGIGTATVIGRQAKRWRVASVATVFAILATLYGLSVTLGSSRTGDITYHVFVLVLLLAILVFLLLPAGKRSLTRT